MNEQEWQTSSDPAAMLRALELPDELPQGRSITPSDRKMRLWVEACRAVDNPPLGGRFPLDTQEGLRCAISLYSGDLIGISGANRANLLREIIGNPFRPVTLPKTLRVEVDAWDGGPAGYRMECPWLTPTVISLAHAAYEDRGRKCETCKGVKSTKKKRYGSIFEGVTLAVPVDCPSCHGTGTIDDGTLDPARLAVLSDALEEAGCPATVVCHACDGTGGWQANSTFVPCELCDGEDPEMWGKLPHPILAHLRSPGPHVCGCWVLDLLLGKD